MIEAMNLFGLKENIHNAINMSHATTYMELNTLGTLSNFFLMKHRISPDNVGF